MMTKGDLLISLKYNPAAKTLEGILLEATNLQKQDRFGLAGIILPHYVALQNSYTGLYIIGLIDSICRDGGTFSYSTCLCSADI